MNDPYQRGDGRDFSEISNTFWNYLLEDGQIRIKRSVSGMGLDVSVVGTIRMARAN